MKIINWNCNGSLRTKFNLIEDLEFDIAIIQECENPALSISKNYKSWAKNYLWIGDNKNKGIGVFAKPNIKLEKLNWDDKFRNLQVKYFLPFQANSEQTFLAIWAHKNDSITFPYVGQIWKYLQLNIGKLKNSIVIGDFNSNSIWDQDDRWWNHSDVVNELKKIGLESLYHGLKDEEQGGETTPTFFHRKKQESHYHIDYVFIPQKLIDVISDFEIGKPEQWLKSSDHMPITFIF